MPRMPQNHPADKNTHHNDQPNSTPAYWIPPKKPQQQPGPTTVIVNDATITARIIALEAKLRDEFTPVDMMKLNELNELVSTDYIYVYNFAESRLERISVDALIIPLDELATILVDDND